jgi:hypothetical protein
VHNRFIGRISAITAAVAAILMLGGLGSAFASADAGPSPSPVACNAGYTACAGGVVTNLTVVAQETLTLSGTSFGLGTESAGSSTAKATASNALTATVTSNDALGYTLKLMAGPAAAGAGPDLNLGFWAGTLNGCAQVDSPTCPANDMFGDAGTTSILQSATGTGGPTPHAWVTADNQFGYTINAVSNKLSGSADTTCTNAANGCSNTANGGTSDAYGLGWSVVPPNTLVPDTYYEVWTVWLQGS